MYKIGLALGGIEEGGTGKGVEAGDPERLRFRVRQFFDACFDSKFPFRPMLEFIRNCIERNENAVELVLPEYCEFEDFVTGRIVLADRQIAVYFEHSLAYLSFSSDTRQDLELLIAVTEGQEFQHLGYSLKDGQL